VATGTIDVAVIGGGYAGLTAALHVLRERPATRVVVIDARALPGERERRGVGESTSELAAWYLAHRLDLREHLEREQIVKFGLRFWLREPGCGTAIGERIEWGPMARPAQAPDRMSVPLEPHAYQLHRGRLEHALAEAVERAGAALLGEQRVIACRDHAEGHELELAGPTGTRTIRARWVIDAGGDGSLTRAALGEAAQERVLDHRIAAAWWWVEGRLDPSTWSGDPTIAERGLATHRWRSTHHLVGDGYWIWLIPLSDGSTSVGLVANEATMPFDGTAQPELAEVLRRELGRLEPELASRLRDLPSSPAIGGRPRSRTFVRPLQRGWLATGGALAFLDPLYSSGHDLTALIHELAIPRILDDLDGRAIDPWLDPVNHGFANVIDHFTTNYVGNAIMLADPAIASLAIGWDQLVYFGWLAVLGVSGKLGDPTLARASVALADRVHRLNARVHALLRRWALVRRGQPRPALHRRHVDQGQARVLMDRFFRLDPLIRGEADAPDVLACLHETVDRLEHAALGLLERSCIDQGRRFPSEPLDPYAVGFDPARWAADGLFNARRARRLDPEVQRDLAYLALAEPPA
jgi:flavin-dependent dehydrogenase